MEAVQLRVAEQYVTQFGNLAKSTTAVVVPASVSDVAGMIAAAMKVFGSVPTATPTRQQVPPPTRGTIPPPPPRG